MCDRLYVELISFPCRQVSYRSMICQFNKVGNDALPFFTTYPAQMQQKESKLNK